MFLVVGLACLCTLANPILASEVWYDIDGNPVRVTEGIDEEPPGKFTPRWVRRERETQRAQRTRFSFNPQNYRIAFYGNRLGGFNTFHSIFLPCGVHATQRFGVYRPAIRVRSSSGYGAPVKRYPCHR